MTTYRTGNAIGSTDPRDLYDNAENLDELVNSQDKAEHPDRLGVPRKTWHGMENEFDAVQTRREGEFQAAQSSREAVFYDFLQASGYQDLGEYAPGIEITAHNQYVTFGGHPYLLKPSVPVPYTTSGEWTGEDFKLIGDDSLRQDLANPVKGAAMVGFKQDVPNAVARTSQSKLTDAVNIKDFGAVPNDVAFADSNEVAFYQALQSGKTVTVTDSYYVRVSASREINVGAVHLLSSTYENKIIFTEDSSGQWLNIGGANSVKIEGIGLYNDLSNSSVHFMVINESDYVDEVVFRNNKVVGRIRVCEGLFDADVDPADKAYGVGRFLITDNVFVDTLTGCFTLPNMPCDDFVIARNKIGNFIGSWLSCGVTNGATYEDELLYSYKKSLRCKDNTVVWDDDFFAPSYSGAYLCFILFEGNYFEEINNHIEGIKTREDKVVYSSYFNGGTIISKGNTVKNIMCFRSDKTGADLFKSKDAMNRYIYNNNYIIEESFVTRHGGSYENEDSWVGIVNQTSNGRIFEMVNNTFDVYSLRANNNSDNMLGVLMKGNTFNCVYYEGALAFLRVRGDYDYTKSSAIIEDNNINTQYLGSFISFAVIIGFGGSVPDPNNVYNIIRVERNTLTESKGPIAPPGVIASVSYNAPGDGPAANDVVFEGNKIITNTSRFFSTSQIYHDLSTRYILKSFKSRGDIVTRGGVFNANTAPREIANCPSVISKATVYGDQYAEASAIPLNVSVPVGGARSVSFIVKGFLGGEFFGGAISFTIKPGSIDFVNPEGEPETFTMGSSTTTVDVLVHDLAPQGFPRKASLRFTYRPSDNSVGPNLLGSSFYGTKGWVEFEVRTQDSM